MGLFCNEEPRIKPVIGNYGCTRENAADAGRLSLVERNYRVDIGYGNTPLDGIIQT